MIMRNKLLFGVLYLCFMLNGFSQSGNTKIDYGFIHHLMNNDMHEEALFLLNQHDAERSALSKPAYDSLQHFLGLINYEIKSLEHSSNAWLNVSENSPFYFQSRFFSAYNYMFLSNTSEAKNILTRLKPENNNLFTELTRFELSGAALLEHDLAQYKIYETKFTGNFYQIEQEQQELKRLYHKMEAFNPRSVALAGILSAIVPGSGKVYAGKLGEGLSSFLTISILGAMTAENYIKDGIKNPKTIVFGSLFSIFYIGNIYGSMVSINVYRDEFYDSIEKSILFHLHIPLRTIFE